MKKHLTNILLILGGILTISGCGMSLTLNLSNDNEALLAIILLCTGAGFIMLAIQQLRNEFFEEQKEFEEHINQYDRNYWI